MGSKQFRDCCQHVAFTGHRPNRISWWSGLWLRGRIRRLMKRIQSKKPKPTLYCGLAEGADMMAAKIALKLGWSIVAVLPAQDMYPPKNRKKADRQRIRILKKAIEVRVIKSDESEPAPYRQAAKVMLAQSDCLIAVHDGGQSAGPGGTHDVISMARLRAMSIYEILI